MPRKIAINSHSTGKFRTEVINNRPHLVTEMVSIEGDSVMNGLGYLLADVTIAHPQLDALPAPASHPTVNGENVSAFHPLAINAFHVGGMVRNPRMVGNQVINELVFDIEVAEKDDRGKEIMSRIQKGESIGVSTGLNADVKNQKGTIGTTPFEGIVSNIQFDHVAVLLDEQPAGDNTFTINKEVTICNLHDSVNELREKVREAANTKFGSDDCCVWIVDILLAPERAIIELRDESMIMVPFGRDDNENIVFTGEGMPVERKVSFEPVGTSASVINREVTDMDKEKLVLAMIGNSANRYTMADKDSLMSMSETELVNGLHAKVEAPAPTVDQAQKVIEDAGMTINAADFNKSQYEKFVENEDAFTAFMANQDKARNEMIDKLVANSRMSKEQLDVMHPDALESLHNSLLPGQNYSAQSQPINNNDRQEESVEVQY